MLRNFTLIATFKRFCHFYHRRGGARYLVISRGPGSSWSCRWMEDRTSISTVACPPIQYRVGITKLPTKKGRLDIPSVALPPVRLKDTSRDEGRLWRQLSLETFKAVANRLLSIPWTPSATTPKRDISPQHKSPWLPMKTLLQFSTTAQEDISGKNTSWKSGHLVDDSLRGP